ncbi:MAG: hypothetical protein LKF44_08195 [Atopobiaceae bacterium]|jgi:hypothetical protein|nr:hypothetical protein [Atopobiaceae bacterium]
MSGITKHYYGIWHAYDERTISEGDRLYTYDTLAELNAAIDKSDGYEHGAITRCTLDYARHNFRAKIFIDNPWDECIDQYGDQYAPTKPCYTE